MESLLLTGARISAAFSGCLFALVVHDLINHSTLARATATATTEALLRPGIHTIIDGRNRVTVFTYAGLVPDSLYGPMNAR